MAKGRFPVFSGDFGYSEKVTIVLGLTLWDLLARIESQVIGMNRLVGVYERA
ncbi:MAG: hypothetical protein U5O69_06030 [Candidatus Competibacteraceae bacterium]|nr:hypothetical protein [Candidatus Competibacteraceae bacterium]